MPGRRYVIAERFVDHDGIVHEPGEWWLFVRHDFLPYEDGLTLTVRPLRQPDRTIRLQWRPETEGAIVDALEDYIVERVSPTGVLD